MSSVIFASPLKAASPLAQSVYDPSATARPILKKDAEASVLFEDPAFALMLAPTARPAAKSIKKTVPMPARADPRYNPIKIAKSEASLNTRIFLQTKPHAGEAVVGAQRFLALNRDSELRQFRRQLADTAPVAVAFGHSSPFPSYGQQDQSAGSAMDESASGAFDYQDAAAHAAFVDDVGPVTEVHADDADDHALHQVDDHELHQVDDHALYQVDRYSDDASDCSLRDDSSASNDEDAAIEALLHAGDDTVQQPDPYPSHSATSETAMAASASALSEPVADYNFATIFPFTSAVPSEKPLSPPSASPITPPLPVRPPDDPTRSDVRRHAPASYSALHAARASPSFPANSSSAAKTSSRPQSSLPVSQNTSLKPSRSAPSTVPPPSFAELSKYSQQVVNELAASQHLEAQHSAKIAQRDLLRLRDSCQRLTSVESSAKHLLKWNTLQTASKSQSSTAALESKQQSHLSEPTPPRSRRPVPNSNQNSVMSVSKHAHASNAGVYDIDEADVAAHVSCSTSAAVTPKQHRAAFVVLPSLSPFFQTPERPRNFSGYNPADVVHNEGFSGCYSRPSPPPVAFHIPLPVVDSVPCTPRPSTPPQPIQNQTSFENDRSPLFAPRNQPIPTPPNFRFADLEAPQAPPYPDMFVNRSANESPGPERSAPASTVRFEPLFQLTDDADHDVFAAISALSAPLHTLVPPQSRFDPKLWLSVIDTDSDIVVRIQRLRAAHLVMSSLVQQDETEVKVSFKRLHELRVDLLWQTKRRQLRFWLNSSGHIVLGPRKKDVVMRFLGLTPASKHAKNISIKEPAPGCPGVSADKRWQGSDFKIQLMHSLVSKYQLHLAFVQFKVNASRARALRHVLACLGLANSRRYILLGWSCFRSWHALRTRTRNIALTSGSNKWFYFLQVVLHSWSRLVSWRVKRQRSVALFQHSSEVRVTSGCFKRWSSGVKLRKHGGALASAANQFWYLTCSLRCILRWWQGAQNLAARKHALRAFAGSNSGNVVADGMRVSCDSVVVKTRGLLSKSEMHEQLLLKRTLAIRRRKHLLAPLKTLLQQQKLAVSALTASVTVAGPEQSRKAEPSPSAVAVSAATRRLFSRTFLLWKGVSDVSARAKDLTFKINTRCKNRSFVFWKYTIALRRGFSCLAIRMQASCSKRALALWLARARLENKCLHSISNRCRLRFLHLVMSSWKIVGRIDALASNWRLKRHFALWLRALPLIASEQSREGSRLNRLRINRSIFAKWRSCVHRNKRLLALLLRGQLLYCKHLLVVVWTTWRLSAAAASLCSRTVKRLHAGRNTRAMRHAFASWASHLGSIRLLRRVFAAAAERWDLAGTLNSEYKRSDLHIMTDCFCAWLRDAKEMKQERLLKSIYATAVVYQSIRRRRNILHSWSRWAYCRFTARKQFERAQSAGLREVLSSWASLAAKTQALARRLQVRCRRKLLENCIASLRAAMQRGKCRRGPVARRYFGALKWYSRTFCVDLPLQHRSRVLQRLVVQAWSRLRLMSLKMALCELTTSRHVLRRKFLAWIAHTGNRKRAIISHRLANAHSIYSTKKRFFCALKRRIADAAREFFLLGKAMLCNSRRCLNSGFQLFRAAAAAQREQRLAQRPLIDSTAAAVTAYPANSEAPPPVSSKVAVFRLEPPSSSSTNVNIEQGSLASLQSNQGAASEPVQQAFRAIPVTVTQSSSAKPVGPVAATVNVANARQGSGAASHRASSQSRAAPAGHSTEASRATHATQTTAPIKPKSSKLPALVVEKVPRRLPVPAQSDVFVVGRPVVSSFVLSGLKPVAALEPPASPRVNLKSTA